MSTLQRNSIGTALGLTWSAHLASARRHWPGAMAGGDSEDLHQLRVALRKTRALLKLFRHALPGADHFEAQFQWLADATGETRDLDVLLAQVQAQADAGGTDDKMLAQPILAQLRGERNSARKKLVATLAGARARNLLDEWEQFLAALPVRSDLPPSASVPAWTALAVIVIEQSRQMLRKGLQIDNATDTAHALHRLRIRAKRLRYLLESFEKTAQKHGLDPLVGKLRKLQTVLGEHQDAVVAAARWQSLAPLLGQRGDVSPATLALLEQWRTEAQARQMEMRAHFGKVLKKFAEACDCL